MGCSGPFSLEFSGAKHEGKEYGVRVTGHYEVLEVLPSATVTASSTPTDSVPTTATVVATATASATPPPTSTSTPSPTATSTTTVSDKTLTPLAGKAYPRSVARTDIGVYTEVRPDNTSRNQARGNGLIASQYQNESGKSVYPYYQRITGDFVGTTEEILEWAAIKWGFDVLGYKELFKAQAVQESYWNQDFVGDNGASFGILQVKVTVWPGYASDRAVPTNGLPGAGSTALSADYAAAIVRYHYDGASWLGGGTKGNMRAAVGAWFCGCADSRGDDYTTKVFNHLSTRRWAQASF